MAESMTANIGTPDFLRGQIKQPSADNLEAPKNIIQTVQGAKALYYQYRAEHLRRIDLYASIEGLIAGNPPYNPVDLAKMKLSHISNFNNLEARSLYEKGALAYWNLLNEVETLVKFEIRNSDLFSGAEPAQLLEWADMMALHWDSVVRSWPSFNVVFNTLTGQLIKFGVSPILWPDERDWRWRTVELSRFFVEDQAQTDIDLLTCICVETIFTAQFLWEVYAKFKDVPKKESPWNIDELSRLLLFLANQFAKTDFEFFDMMDIQRRVQNGDLTFNAIFTDSIRIVSLFYQEYDGKISHYMFHPRYDSGDFIYFADRQYDSLGEGVAIFTASPGEFTIHSNRGLGHKIYSGSQAMMQLDCSIIDMARMSATPLIKTVATGTKDFETIRFYPGVPTNIGQAELVENTLGEHIQQLILASQYVQRKLQVNVANSGDDPSQPDSNIGSVSPSEARMKSYKEFSVLKNNIAHFYGQFDGVVVNMTVKMLRSKQGFPGYEYAAEWKRRCVADGVPKEMFLMKNTNFFGMPEHLKVRASRVAGDGSTAARLMALQELLPIASSFGPNEEAEYKREWVMSTMGPEKVGAFTQDTNKDNSASNQGSQAGTENGIMRLGESPIFSVENEHRAHFSVHMALGKDTIDRIQQQQLSAKNADSIFTVLIPHMDEHFKALEKNIFAKTFTDGVRKPWDQLRHYSDLNRHNAAKEIQAAIAKQQQDAEKTQTVMSDAQRKDFKTQSDIQNSRTKVNAQIENASQANQRRGEVMQEKAHSDADNKRLEIQLKHDAETAAQQTKDVVKEPLPALRQELSNINGQTPAPYDIETA